MNEWRYCLKCFIIGIFILYFSLKKYLHSFIQSVYRTCSPPNKPRVGTVHDRETCLNLSISILIE